MKALILYATKSGATREIARRIAAKLDGAQAFDLKERELPGLEQFDCVIIGSAVYAGMIRKEAKEFIRLNAELLCKKRLGLFLSGMNEKSEAQTFEANFPGDVLQASAARAFLGGIFDPKKAGALGRMIMKAVSKQSEYTDNILAGRLDRFVEEMKA